MDEKSENVVLWGSGRARREFLHVDDLARAVIFLMERFNSSEIINVGSGTDISIRDLADMIALKVNYIGKIELDTSMPDGMLRKCLDVSKLTALGFRPSIALSEGLDQVIHEYRRLKAHSQPASIVAANPP